MIECTAENIWYKKRKRFKFKKFIAFFLILLILVGCFLYYKFIISLSITNICTDYAYSCSTEAANYAVLNSLQDSVSYGELVSVQKNSNGDIVLISANSQKVNEISRRVVEIAQENVKSKLNKGVPIPILAFTGIELLHGFGREIYLKTINITSAKCDFNSTFTSVGINQTLHSIYIDVTINVSISFPLNKKMVKCVTTILMSETVLVGKVPDIYLNGHIFQ